MRLSLGGRTESRGHSPMPPLWLLFDCCDQWLLKDVVTIPVWSSTAAADAGLYSRVKDLDLGTKLSSEGCVQFHVLKFPSTHDIMSQIWHKEPRRGRRLSLKVQSSELRSRSSWSEATDSCNRTQFTNAKPLHEFLMAILKFRFLWVCLCFR